MTTLKVFAVIMFVDHCQVELLNVQVCDAREVDSSCERWAHKNFFQIKECGHVNKFYTYRALIYSAYDLILHGRSLFSP